MTAFYIIGGAFAGWALLVSFIGITSKGFPASKGAATVVGVISAALAIAAVTSAIVGALNTEHGGGEEEHGSAPAAVRSA